jgi:uncharacterized protein with PQ loop repeat
LTEQPPRDPRARSAGINAMAVVSLVCSLLGWLCFIGGIFGLIFGFVALNQIKQTGQRGRRIALAGIIIGGILVALWIAVGIVRATVRHTANQDSGAPAVVMIVEPQAVSPILAA